MPSPLSTWGSWPRSSHRDRAGVLHRGPAASAGSCATHFRARPFFPLGLLGWGQVETGPSGKGACTLQGRAGQDLESGRGVPFLPRKKPERGWNGSVSMGRGLVGAPGSTWPLPSPGCGSCPPRHPRSPSPEPAAPCPAPAALAEPVWGLPALSVFAPGTRDQTCCGGPGPWMAPGSLFPPCSLSKHPLVPVLCLGPCRVGLGAWSCVRLAHWPV